MQEKQFTSTITLVFSGNEDCAVNQEEYRQKVKERFYEDYGIELSDNEITQIEEVQ